MKQSTKLCILFVGIIAISFLLGGYFYKKNLRGIRTLADTCFVETLKSELSKKQEQLNIPYFYSGSCLDTAALTIRITTAEGTKIFKVDPEKSKKNISASHIERGLHSILCVLNPLSSDSLNVLWHETIGLHDIAAPTSTHISTTDLQGKTSHSLSEGEDYSKSPYSLAFVTYIGNRCELEVCGYLQISWWQIILYHWGPFFCILVGIAIAMFVSYYLVNRPVMVEVFEKEVLREVIKFVERPEHCPKTERYRLTPTIIFDAPNRLLVRGEKEVILSPQSCVILKLFLNAPDCTLSDKMILNGIWGEGKCVDLHLFHAATHRMYQSFSEIELSARFSRVGTNQYQLVISDDVF